MGKEAQKIVQAAGVDVCALVKLLNKAYSDEWLAYYQYWVGAKVASGKAAHQLIGEMEEHAKEELEHATLLAKRIVELGGEPVLSPQEWFKESTCGYLSPENADSKVILAQNLSSERCAIAVYNKLLPLVAGKDLITTHLLRKILQDEIEHEQELEDIGLNVEDIESFCCTDKK